MEPETKKKIAEALGYKDTKVGVLGVWINRNETPKIFDPETNDTQLWECLTLIIKEEGTIKFEKYLNGDFGLIDNWKEDYAFGEGDTPKAAVIAVLNEMFGE